MRIAIPVLFVALSASLVFSVPIHNLNSKWTADFDFFYLVLGWPPSICDTSAGCHVPTDPAPVANDFWLHGLWPNYNNGSWPQFCGNTPYDRNQISSILTDMSHFWPAVLTDSEDQFWGHEWTKHGTCSAPVLSSELNYFQTILTIRKKFNLLNLFVQSGVNPGTSAQFTAVEMANAISKSFGFAPDIRCNADPKGQKQMQEVYLCLDKTLNYMNCPPEQHSHGQQYVSCGDGAVMMLPLNSTYPPSPPAPPAPPATQCAAGHHGPACKADADCASFSGCVRCASSGFCTSTPK